MRGERCILGPLSILTVPSLFQTCYAGSSSTSVYTGPAGPAFDGTWKPGDVEEVT